MGPYRNSFTFLTFTLEQGAIVYLCTVPCKAETLFQVRGEVSRWWLYYEPLIADTLINEHLQ